MYRRFSCPAGRVDRPAFISPPHLVGYRSVVRTLREGVRTCALGGIPEPTRSDMHRARAQTPRPQCSQWESGNAVKPEVRRRSQNPIRRWNVGGRAVRAMRRHLGQTRLVLPRASVQTTTVQTPPIPVGGRSQTSPGKKGEQAMPETRGWDPPVMR